MRTLKDKRIVLIMATFLWLFIVLLTSSADIRTQKLNEQAEYIKYLQGEIDTTSKRALYKFQFVDGLRYPVKEIHRSRITSFYDTWRVYKRRFFMHRGLDVFVYGEAWVKPMKSGIIHDVYNDKLMGWTVEIMHVNSITKYSHFERVVVKKGDIVGTNKSIGKIGNTGKLSRGNHAHIEWHPLVDGRYINSNMIEGEKKRSQWWGDVK